MRTVQAPLRVIGKPDLSLGVGVAILPRPEFNFGWVRDEHSSEDLYMSAIIKARAKFPDRMDLRKCDEGMKTENQGNEGSCVGHGGTSAVEYCRSCIQNLPMIQFSRNFLYYNARARQGWEKVDSGCQIRDAMWSLSKHGVCPETFWPYDTKKWAQKPSEKAYAEAQKFKIEEYRRCATYDECCYAMGQKFPVVFGIPLYESFNRPSVAETGMVPRPNRKSERQIGGHCMDMWGYERGKWTLAFNSYGNFGDNGFLHFPEDYVIQEASDCWCITKIAEMKET